ncbi:transporter, basic amino acid/polyamine antiporter (APA) family [Serratia fonticola]|uniref:Transporter, basic amino acid/polyamine antiporter (APA) family n=1 Tax=Serratia fonticola TaxID=47917 RepID=A0A4U9TIS7_SERFO|nr:transporter, basic amino acid/polyamine antiporter (APA) family [Serratia fonticola]
MASYSACLSFYASQIQYVALVPILLTCGLPVFIWSRKEKGDNQPLFQNKEIFYLAILLLLDAIVIWLLMMGRITL